MSDTKLYRSKDVQVLIQALKTCEHEGDIINTLEAFKKIEPVSVPFIDMIEGESGSEFESRLKENERIRKVMEGNK